MAFHWLQLPDAIRRGYSRRALTGGLRAGEDRFPLGLDSRAVAARSSVGPAAWARGAVLPTRSGRVLRIAHRGASGYAPENTWSAFHKALELKVDMVELDVRRTRDHELVVCHDARLDRLTGVWTALKRLSYVELQQVVVRGEPIPRLAEVLEFLAPSCLINIELKERGLAEAAVATVKALGCQSQVVFSSFFASQLVRLKAIDPTVRVVALVGATPVTVKTCLRFAHVVQAEALSVGYAAFQRRLLVAAHQQGLAVYVWTVDDPAAIAHLKALGVDGIMSNYPDRI